MPFAWDASDWPIVVCVQEGEFSMEDAEAQISSYEEALARRAPHVVIIDARRARVIVPATRKRFAQWVKGREVDLASYRLGTVTITSSPVVRGVLSAIYWVSPPPYPHTVVASRADAERQAHEWLTPIRRR
jgi:hypothetical protein